MVFFSMLVAFIGMIRRLHWVQADGKCVSSLKTVKFR